jgi:glycosyltransferase involved in cell wall biosynthesis
MRILYIITGAEYGGAVVHVVELVREDLKNGHIVGIAAAPERRLMNEASNMHAEFFPNPYFVRRVKLLNDLLSLGPVFRAIRQFKPDLVTAHSTKAGYAARIACALLRKPVIFTAHGWAFSEGESSWRRKLLPLAERLAALVTQRIICVSQHDLELAVKQKVAPSGKLRLVHNGLDPAPFLVAKGDSVRREFGLQDQPVLTMVARLSPPKDPLTLLEACRLLKGEYKCLLVGDGELREQVERFVSQNGLASRIILAGERKDIPQILAASQVFVLTSYKEGLPISIIEAGLAGLPVIASRVGGIPELVQDGINGYIVPPADAPALAKTIQRLLDDADLRQRLGKASREKTLGEFVFDRMYNKTHEVYREVRPA